ncbi:MAG: hypothetical protein RL518_620 [Pseudomonadota bacterium]
MVDRFTQECPGLAGSVARLYGREVLAAFAQHYCAAADLGGNDELGVLREEGMSFNPRIARVVSLVIQECEEVTPAVLKAAVYGTVPSTVALSSDILAEVREVRSPSPSSPTWAKCIALVLMLDRVRHLHMADIPVQDKETILAAAESSPLLAANGGAPQNIRLKVIHGIAMQRRRINIEAEG